MKRAPLIDLERADQLEPEKILVKRPGLLRIPAAIGVVVQPLDHHQSSLRKAHSHDIANPPPAPSSRKAAGVAASTAISLTWSRHSHRLSACRPIHSNR